MTCKELIEFLADYLADEIEPGAAARLKNICRFAHPASRISRPTSGRLS